jgi:hypothetical protein
LFRIGLVVEVLMHLPQFNILLLVLVVQVVQRAVLAVAEAEAAIATLQVQKLQVATLQQNPRWL